MSTWTAQDWAVFVAAIGSVALPALGAFIVQMVQLARSSQDRLQRKVDKLDTDKKLQDLHEQGNSNLQEARKLSEALGVEKGKALGVTQERANPMTPQPKL